MPKSRVKDKCKGSMLSNRRFSWTKNQKSHSYSLCLSLAMLVPHILAVLVPRLACPSACSSVTASLRAGSTKPQVFVDPDILRHPHFSWLRFFQNVAHDASFKRIRHSSPVF